MKTKSLMDLLFEFVDQTHTHMKIEKQDGWVITIENVGCIDHVHQTNAQYIEQLAPGYSFDLVMIKGERFIYVCVEKDITLIIQHIVKQSIAKDKKKNDCATT